MALRWIILFPLFGAILNGLIVRSKNALVAGGIATVAALMSFGAALGADFALSGEGLRDAWFTWFSTGRISVSFTLEVVPITGIMLLVVTGIGSLIHMYSIGYMSHDKAPHRFFSYLNLFLAAMLTLILSSDLVGVFLGWEGVGLCSYLLIGFWFSEDKNCAAAMKAFVVNRIGDLGFILALGLLVGYVGSTEIKTVLAKFAEPGIPAWVGVAVAGGLFWACTGKSAQLPLYIWLPDAMAGPTPVSALIHAATMVTSGLFLIVRMWPLFAAQQGVLNVILAVGIATAWIAALTALTQRDIKKVLAYSTVSQLGFMFAALGLGSPVAALFHVVTHAAFKALMFLGAGSVIHGMHEKQDLGEMGGLRRHMPWTHWTFLAGNLAIIGFPLTSGFFSKDMIIAKAFEYGMVPFVLLVGAALLTSFYMFRLYALAFWGEPRSKEADHAHESPAIMVGPLAILAVLSIFAGWIETPEVIGHITALTGWVESSWYGLMHHAAEHEEHAVSHATEWMLILGVSTASILVAFASFKKYSTLKKLEEGSGAAFNLSWNKFYVDEIYQMLFARPLSYLADFVAAVFDRFVIEGIVNGSERVLRITGSALSMLQTGSVQTYAWYVAAGSALTLWILQRMVSR